MYRHKQFNQTKPYLQTWTKVIITNHTALQKNLTQERLYKAESHRNLLRPKTGKSVRCCRILYLKTNRKLPLKFCHKINFDLKYNCLRNTGLVHSKLRPLIRQLKCIVNIGLFQLRLSKLN